MKNPEGEILKDLASEENKPKKKVVKVSINNNKMTFSKLKLKVVQEKKYFKH